MVRQNVCAAILFPSFSRPFPKIDFWMHFGRPLAPFWLPFGSRLAPFDSLLAPFGSLLAPFGTLWATFSLQLTHFWCYLAHFCPFGGSFSNFSHRFAPFWFIFVKIRKDINKHPFPFFFSTNHFAKKRRNSKASKIAQNPSKINQKSIDCFFTDV